MDFPYYYSIGLVGYDVTASDDGSFIYYRFVSPSGPESQIHRVKVRYTAKGAAYFLAHGRRVYLDDCLRKTIGMQTKRLIWW